MKERVYDNFVQSYLEYTNIQESPDSYHLWVALILIASVLNRRVYMDKAMFDLYPNLYVFLIAGTSKCHKSTAIRMGLDVLDTLSHHAHAREEPRVFAQKITNERLIQFLGEGSNVEMQPEGANIQFKASGMIAASELSTFLGSSAVQSGLMATLVDLFDCQETWSYETKSSGKDKLTNVYLNMLGASTEKWLRNAIPVEAVGGGIMSRTVFVYESRPKRLIPFPEDEEIDNLDQFRINLAHDLACMQYLEGTFSLSEKAKAYYKEWYIKNAEESMNHGAKEDFFSRWDTIILKLGMLLSVSESDDLIVKRKHLQMADTMLNERKEKMKPVIDTMIVTDSQLPTSRVLGIIRRRKSVTKTSLMQYASPFASSEDVAQIINTLEQAGYIQTNFRPGGETTYKYLGED